MPQLLVCPRGHRWDPSAASSSGGDADAPVCPVCGAREAAPVADTVDTGVAPAMTLPLPPRPPRASQPPDESGPTVAMPVKPAALPLGDAYEASGQTLPTTARDHVGPASDVSDVTLASPGSVPRPAAAPDATLPLPPRSLQQPAPTTSDSSLPPLNATLPARAPGSA